MKALNKILIIFLILVLIPLGVAIFIIPITVLQTAGTWMVDLSATLQGIPTWVRLSLGILFAVAWVVVGILFLILQLRRPRAKLVRVERIDGGEVEVSLRTVGEHVAYEVDQMAGVLRVRTNVAARKGGVVVEVDVDTAGDVEVPNRAAQIVEVVRRVVEERVGVKLTRPPKVRLRATPAPLTARPRSRPKPAPVPIPALAPEPIPAPTPEPEDVEGEQGLVIADE